MYKLHSTRAADIVWDDLPDDAREEFDRAITLACQDPWKHTKPRNPDDPRDVRRTIPELQHTVAALLIIEGPPVRWLYLRNLDYLG